MQFDGPTAVISRERLGRKPQRAIIHGDHRNRAYWMVQFMLVMLRACHLLDARGFYTIRSKIIFSLKWEATSRDRLACNRFFSTSD